jgi:hypothetical protein
LAGGGGYAGGHGVEGYWSDMKSPLATSIAIAFGLIVLVGYFLQSTLMNQLVNIFVSWAVILGAVATLVGILNLMLVHWNKIRSGQKGYVYSMVTILAFIFTVVIGIILKPSNAQFTQVVTSVMLPIEASLMALLAVTLAYASIRLLRQRGINLLSITFVISVLVFLVLNLGLLSLPDHQLMTDLVLALNRIPVAGARGLILGIALGSLTAGLRILIGTDRPYGG